MRGEYEVRVQARLGRSAGRDVGREMDREQSRAEEPATKASTAKASAAKPQSLEEIRREARENWLRLRQSRMQQPAEATPSAAKSRGRDDDLDR